eukprot:c22141_g1_i4 orf=56-319(-)
MVGIIIIINTMALLMATPSSKATIIHSLALADQEVASSEDAWRRCVAAGWWMNAAACAIHRASWAVSQSPLLEDPVSHFVKPSVITI